MYVTDPRSHLTPLTHVFRRSRRGTALSEENPVLLHLPHSALPDRDLRELGGHSPGPMEAAVAGERHSSLPHPPPGRQRQPPRPVPHRRPCQRLCGGGTTHPSHLGHGTVLNSSVKHEGGGTGMTSAGESSSIQRKTPTLTTEA